MIDTPNANRVHIGIFGKRNSGKSSLINAITNQNIAIISEELGTTTDPVYKAMEINGIGPCMIIDTAGFDDVGTLGALRLEKTKEALQKTDIGIIVITDTNMQMEKKWIELLKKGNKEVILVVNKSDILDEKYIKEITGKILEHFKVSPILVSAKIKTNIGILIEEIIKKTPDDFDKRSLTEGLCSEGDTVLLVMPQDIQAPKGRLILPQVQVMRDLLDKKCIVMSITTDKLDMALESLKLPPKLIITDSQVFSKVKDKKPAESLLTSFSILMAASKGSIEEFIAGANAVDKLADSSKVLIAEACTHAPMEEDIGRVKIPRLLRDKVGESLKIDIVAGVDFPKDLSSYDLIIHCGGCMFNKSFVMSRIKRAKEADVPITNYGVILAKLSGILDYISF